MTRRYRDNLIMPRKELIVLYNDYGLLLTRGELLKAFIDNYMHDDIGMIPGHYLSYHFGARCFDVGEINTLTDYIADSINLIGFQSLFSGSVIPKGIAFHEIQYNTGDFYEKTYHKEIKINSGEFFRQIPINPKFVV